MNGAVKLEGVVVKKIPYRDTDLILGIFTKEKGKVSVFVPGARRSTKRFGPYLDLFAQIDLVAESRSAKSMLRLKETSLISPHMHIRQSLDAMSFATYYAECMWNLLAEFDPHVDLYNDFLHMLDHLSDLSQPYRSLFRFEYQLLETCGYNPEFDMCSVCKKGVQGQSFFSFQKGSVLCAACRMSDQGKMVSKNAMEVLAQTGEMPRGVYMELQDLMADFISFTIGKPLKSRAFRKDTMKRVSR